MVKLSEKEKLVLAELESETLPEVAAIRLKMNVKTLGNYRTKIRKKCFEAGRFLKDMESHQKILRLRIKVTIEEETRRKV